MSTATIDELIKLAKDKAIYNSQLMLREPIYFQTFNDARKSGIITGTELLDIANNMLGEPLDSPDRIKDVSVAIQELTRLDEDRFVWEIEE